MTKIIGAILLLASSSPNDSTDDVVSTLQPSAVPWEGFKCAPLDSKCHEKFAEQHEAQFRDIEQSDYGTFCGHSALLCVTYANEVVKKQGITSAIVGLRRACTVWGGIGCVALAELVEGEHAEGKLPLLHDTCGKGFGMACLDEARITRDLRKPTEPGFMRAFELLKTQCLSYGDGRLLKPCDMNRLRGRHNLLLQRRHSAFAREESGCRPPPGPRLPVKS